MLKALIIKWIRRAVHKYFSLPKMVADTRRIGLVDEAWYLEINQDVAENRLDPVKHYILFGAEEGRLPCKNFNVHEALAALEDRECPLGNFLEKHYVEQFRNLKSNSRRIVPSYIQIYDQVTYPRLDAYNAIDKNALNKKVIIIIPVFNAFYELEKCIESLIRSDINNSHIVVINDASTQRGFDVIKQKFRNDFIHYEENKTNLGFSGTVNLGIAKAKAISSAADFVLLNSDTVVSDNWLNEIKMVAFSTENVGTVTAVSNAAGPFSFFSFDHDSPSISEINRIGEYFRKFLPYVGVSVPTGHGFCMFLSRRLIDQVGHFDEKAFPQGYGEENDLCMRAQRAGFYHFVALRAFVFHKKSASFGAKREQLVTRGRKIIDTRYPNYTNLVSSAFGSPDFSRLRKFISNKFTTITKNSFAEKRILFVISTESGGTPQTNLDLMRQLEISHDCFLLVSDSKYIRLYLLHNSELCMVFEHELFNEIDPIQHESKGYDTVVASWIVQLNIDLIHVRHIAWHSLGLFNIAKSLNIPTVLSFHDFYTLCPTVKLLDGDNVFCSGECTSPENPCVPELWSPAALSQLNRSQVYVWREKFRRIIPSISTFVTTSHEPKMLILKFFQEIDAANFHVIPHGRDFERFFDLAKKPKLSEKIKILCPGNITVAKGLKFINEVALNFSELVEIHVLGAVSNEVQLCNNIVIHGTYKRDDFHKKVLEINPNVGGVFSIWPETWCHTLTELLSCGIPVLSFGLGAVEERIQSGELGWVLNTQRIEELASLVSNDSFIDEWTQKKDNVIEWQKGEGCELNTNLMSQRYKSIYDSLL